MEKSRGKEKRGPPAKKNTRWGVVVEMNRWSETDITELIWWGGKTSLRIETNAVRVRKITRIAAEK